MKKAFTDGNTKLRQVAEYYGIPKTHVVTFNLPSGWTCPGALDCKTKVTREGELTQHGEIRCYMASMENFYTAKRNQVWRNFDAIFAGRAEARGNWIISRLDKEFPRAEICRIHSGGDFFNQTYFNAWMYVAEEKPNIRFYAYTKSLTFWLHYLQRRSNSFKSFPPNVKMIASKGGRYDKLIDKYKWRSVEIVTKPHKTLKTYQDDFMTEIEVLEGNDSFAIMLHGTQKKEAWDYEYGN